MLAVPKTKNSGAVIFTLENVIAENHQYDPEDNIESWDSIDMP